MKRIIYALMVAAALIAICFCACVPAHAQGPTESGIWQPKTTPDYSLGYGDLLYHLPINHPNEEAFVDSLLIAYARELSQLRDRMDIEAGEQTLKDMKCLICLQAHTYKKYRRCMLNYWFDVKK